MDQKTMKAVLCTAYGSPEVLKIKELQKPVPAKNGLLIKIMATAVNSGDVRVRSLDVNGFLKIIMRFVLGFSKPRKPVLGTVYSGIVEECGTEVTTFKEGDKVFGQTGFRFGTYAQYIAVSEKSTVFPMPVNASFEEASALPFGGHTALYFLQKADIGKDASLLIYGATGSVGLSALQLGDYYNAKTTAVCSTAGKRLIEQMNVQHIICYDEEDFTKINQQFDIIFDAVGKITRKQCKHLLKKDGRFVTVGGLDTAAENTVQLKFLKELFESGSYKATIDRAYPFDQIKEAHHYVDSKRKKGDVVINKIND